MSRPPIDPAHWLFRLPPEDWLKAARHELAAGEQAITGADQRRAVTYARRAAGMALNAVLFLQPTESWGRSYMDHIRAVVEDTALPDAIREAANVLVETPTGAPAFVRLGGGADIGPAAAAARIIVWCESVVNGG